MERQMTTPADSAAGPREYLTEAEAADLLRVSPRTLQRQRASGDGPRCWRVGKRRVVYTRDALDAWLRSREPAPATGG
mgnify:CR=1 FL=1